MKSRFRFGMMIGIFALAAMMHWVAAATPVSELKATARDGRVFLTWKEAETPDGTTFNVYVSDSPHRRCGQGQAHRPSH